MIGNFMSCSHSIRLSYRLNRAVFFITICMCKACRWSHSIPNAFQNCRLNSCLMCYFQYQLSSKLLLYRFQWCFYTNKKIFQQAFNVRNVCFVDIFACFYTFIDGMIQIASIPIYVMQCSMWPMVKLVNLANSHYPANPCASFAAMFCSSLSW